MKKLYVIEGGIGRELMFSALLPKLSETQEIITFSSYPDIFDNNPYVYRSLSRTTPYAWEDFVMNDENEIVFYDPYFHPDFIKRKIHVVEAYARGLGVEYTSNMLPEVYLSKKLKDDAINFKRENGEFIIIQFTSGQSPLNPNLQQSFKWDGFKREYTFENAQELVNLIKKKYPKLILLNYCLPNEATFNLEGTLKINAPYLFYAALLEKSLGFVGINSSLTHMAAAVRKKGVVLWGGTSPDQWGYKIHNNISGECKDLYCSRPYLRELGDYTGSGARWSCSTGQCMEIEPERVFKELNNTLDLSPAYRNELTQQKREDCSSNCKAS